MGLFNKLANILFDEEEVEDIPTITKAETKTLKKEEDVKEKLSDEIIVTKVEGKKVSLEDTIEMPKPIEEKDVETKKFTFPFMDDDDDDLDEMPKRTTLKTKEDYSYANTIQKDIAPKKHDFLSSKNKNPKSDAYTANRNNIYDPTADKNEHRPFTLSPIISPVYGILNENYTKDDIIEKNSSARRNADKIDFDSVRRKAYGTLEDEIEVSLSRGQEEMNEDKPKQEMTIENLREDGISINDLLIGDEEDEKTEELFDIEEVSDITVPVKEDTVLIENEENIIEDKSDDLFDLIDSIYAGKDKDNND